MNSLCLIRHGETAWHAAGKIAGRSDVALSNKGIEELRTSAGKLHRSLTQTSEPAPFRNARWFASPAQRTRDSASILRRALLQAANAAGTVDVQLERSLTWPVTVDERLAELDFGDWEARTWESVHQQEGDELAAWGEDWVHRATPNGESFEQQCDRCRAWLDDWLRMGDVADEPRTDADSAAVLVIHGGSIRALICLLLDRPLDTAMNFRVDTAGMSVLRRDHRGTPWRLVSLNADSWQ